MNLNFFVRSFITLVNSLVNRLNIINGVYLSNFSQYSDIILLDFNNVLIDIFSKSGPFSTLTNNLLSSDYLNIDQKLLISKKLLNISESAITSSIKWNDFDMLSHNQIDIFQFQSINIMTQLNSLNSVLINFL
jgi:hypothetical protein